jgi:hypothetical protein
MSASTTDLSLEYEAVPFTLQEFEPMKELFRSAFGTALTYNTFIKRFDTSSLGCKVIGYIAKHRKSRSPAAYYGVFPVKLLTKDMIVLAAQSGDTMTHQDHRKKGLFLWLAKMTFEMCRTLGIQFVFGIPNQNSYPGFINRLHWLHLDNINSYDLKLKIKTVPFAKMALKLGIFSLYLKGVKHVLKRKSLLSVEQFLNPITSVSRVFRDSNYIAYKQTIDKVFLKIHDVILWVRFSDVLWIGDFDNYNKIDKKLIGELTWLAALLGYNTIRFNFNANLPQPDFLQYFKKQNQEPSCYYYINKDFKNTNLVLTAADFDTW